MNKTEKNIKVNVTDVTPTKGAESQVVGQCRQQWHLCCQENIMTVGYAHRPRLLFRSPAFGLQRPHAGLFIPDFGRPGRIGANVTDYTVSQRRNHLSIRQSHASGDSGVRFIKNIIFQIYPQGINKI